jgi:hypothetical protein
MTLYFDERARQQFATISHPELEYSNESLNSLVVKQIGVDIARPYIATYHYSKSMPDSTRFVYAGYLGDKLAGIVVFGMGSNDKQYQYLIPDIKRGEYLELTRLWSPDTMPKNTESKLISQAIKLLPKEIKLLISFADSGQNHTGYIYQALSWYFTGKTTVSKSLIDANGVKRHSKSINMVRLRHPEYTNSSSDEIMKAYGWEYTKSYEKYRYCYLRGSKREKKVMLKQIKDKIMDYPKSDKIGFTQNEMIIPTNKQASLFDV